MAHQTNNVKQFLDKAGVEALWTRIYNGFAPRWQSYKPSNTSSSEDDKLPADFINTYESDHIVNGDKDGRKSLNVTFVSAGAIKDAEGNKYGRDLVIQIPEVKAPSTQNGADGAYGVMSPADKWKLDNVANTAEDKVTIKGVKVKNSKLELTNKFVNWDLVYNDTNNTLDIVDLNSSSNVLTSVNVDDMLADAIKKGFLSAVEFVDKKDGETEASGMYLKFIFTTGIGTDESSIESKTIYVDVKDLVDIYSPGTGISITQGTYNTADKTSRSSTINLKTATTGEIGGVKLYNTNTKTVAARTSSITADVTGTNHRYFGVEIDKNEQAFVNVPKTPLNVEATDLNDDSIEIVTGTDTVKVFAGYGLQEDGTDGWKMTPTYKNITIGKETDWSTSGNVGEDGKELGFGDTFTVFKDIVSGGTNGHGAVKSNTTFTMPTETTLSLPDATKGTDNNISTEYTNAAETINGIENVPVSHQSITITTSAVTSVNNHAISRTTTDNKFDICIPAIELDFINSLVYKVL